MSDIVERLKSWCTDWNGAQMVRGEPPRDGLHCDDLLDAVAEIERLRGQVERLKSCLENIRVTNLNGASYVSVVEVGRGFWSAQITGGHELFDNWQVKRDAALSSLTSTEGQ